jgi:hypothetical protein
VAWDGSSFFASSFSGFKKQKQERWRKKLFTERLLAGD